jgi:hypothetical protein
VFGQDFLNKKSIDTVYSPLQLMKGNESDLQDGFNIVSLDPESNFIGHFGQFGLSHEPTTGQNIYLTYGIEFENIFSKAEIGFSVSNFTSITFSLVKSISFNKKK